MKYIYYFSTAAVIFFLGIYVGNKRTMENADQIVSSPVDGHIADRKTVAPPDLKNPDEHEYAPKMEDTDQVISSPVDGYIADKKTVVPPGSKNLDEHKNALKSVSENKRENKVGSVELIEKEDDLQEEETAFVLTPEEASLTEPPDDDSSLEQDNSFDYYATQDLISSMRDEGIPEKDIEDMVGSLDEPDRRGFISATIPKSAEELKDELIASFTEAGVPKEAMEAMTQDLLMMYGHNQVAPPDDDPVYMEEESENE